MTLKSDFAGKICFIRTTFTRISKPDSIEIGSLTMSFH
jgi:hypothetical protein